MADLVEYSRQGETVDALVWRVVAGDAGAAKSVLEANRGLAALGPVLPMGTPVTIPEGATAKASSPQFIQLWD